MFQSLPLLLFENWGKNYFVWKPPYPFVCSPVFLTIVWNNYSMVVCQLWKQLPITRALFKKPSILGVHPDGDLENSFLKSLLGKPCPNTEGIQLPLTQDSRSAITAAHGMCCGWLSQKFQPMSACNFHSPKDCTFCLCLPLVISQAMLIIVCMWSIMNLNVLNNG